MRSKQVFKNLLANILLQIAIAISGLLMPRFYLLSYGSDTYGMIVSIGQFIAYMALVEVGIAGSSIVALYGPLAKRDMTAVNGILAATAKFYKQSGMVYSLLIIGLIIGYPYLIKDGMNVELTRSAILILSIGNLLDYLFFAKYRILLFADNRSYVISLASTLGTIFNTSSALLLMMCGVSIVYVLLVSTLVYFLRTILIFSYVRRHYSLLDFRQKPKTSALKEKRSLIIHQVTGIVYRNCDVILLTIFFKEKSLVMISVYSIYRMINNMIFSLIDSLSGSVSASIGQLVHSDHEESLRQAYNNYEFVNSMTVSLVYTAMWLLYMPFIRIYTEGVTDADYIHPILAMMFVLSGYFYSIRMPGIQLINSAGHFKRTQGRALIELCIILGVSILFIHSFGAIAILAGSLVTMIYSTITASFYCNRYLLKKTFANTAKRLLRNAAIGVTMGILLTKTLNLDSIDTPREWILHALIIVITLSVCFIGVNAWCEYKRFRIVFSAISGIFH